MSELGLHKSGTNTNDATATASDILNNKTAYVKGVKVTGTQSLASLTADATATAADIMPGKTGYVNGIKLIGTATADATAGVSDVAAGKTFYAGGTKKTGTLQFVKSHGYTKSSYQLLPENVSTVNLNIGSSYNLYSSLSVDPTTGIITPSGYTQAQLNSNTYISSFLNQYVLWNGQYWKLMGTPYLNGESLYAYPSSQPYPARKTIVTITLTDAATYPTETAISGYLYKDVTVQ